MDFVSVAQLSLKLGSHLAPLFATLVLPLLPTVFTPSLAIAIVPSSPLVPSWLVPGHALPATGVIGNLPLPTLLLLTLTITLLPREDVFHLLVHPSQILSREGQEGICLGHTRLPGDRAVEVEIEVRTSLGKGNLWTRTVGGGSPGNRGGL